MNALWKCHPNATPIFNSESATQSTQSSETRVLNDGLPDDDDGVNLQDSLVPNAPLDDPENFLYTVKLTCKKRKGIRFLKSALQDFDEEKIKTISSSSPLSEALSLRHSSLVRSAPVVGRERSESVFPGPSIISRSGTSVARLRRTSPQFQSRPPRSIHRNVPPELNDLVEKLWKQDAKGNIRKYLQTFQPASVQELIDLLSDKGFATPDVLVLFRFSMIHSLRLSGCLDRDPLDIIGFPYSKAFGSKDAFPFLTELDLSDIYIADEDVRFFSHLPRLKVLVLENTGVGDEGVMHLIGLKDTIQHLNFAANTRVTDESTICLIKIKMLDFVVLQGTSITMAGLRRLAITFKGRISISPPLSCMTYLKRISDDNANLYVAVRELTVVELKERLRVFAKEDSRISLYGSKVCLQEQLKAALQRRREDALVKKCLLVTE